MNLIQNLNLIHIEKEQNFLSPISHLAADIDVVELPQKAEGHPQQRSSLTLLKISVENFTLFLVMMARLLYLNEKFISMIILYR